MASLGNTTMSGRGEALARLHGEVAQRRGEGVRWQRADNSANVHWSGLVKEERREECLGAKRARGAAHVGGTSLAWQCGGGAVVARQRASDSSGTSERGEEDGVTGVGWASVEQAGLVGSWELGWSWASRRGRRGGLAAGLNGEVGRNGDCRPVCDLKGFSIYLT